MTHIAILFKDMGSACCSQRRNTCCCKSWCDDSERIPLMDPFVDEKESENTAGERKFCAKDEQHVRVLKEKNKIIREKDEKIQRLEEQIDDHQKILAHSFGPGVGTESSSDKNTPEMIKMMFTNVYKTHRKDLSRKLHVQSVSEDKRIKIIIVIVKTTHDLCSEFADNQIRDFLYLERNKALDNESKYAELYRIRSEVSQDDDVVKRMTKKVVEKVEEQVYAIGEIDQENCQIKEVFRKFVEELAKCFWISQVAKKKVYFDFDVEIGKEYDPEKFTAYSGDKCNAFEDDRYAPKTVYSLVWPRMFLQPGNEMLVKKGIVAEVYGKVAHTNDEEIHQDNFGENANSCIP